MPPLLDSPVQLTQKDESETSSDSSGEDECEAFDFTDERQRRTPQTEQALAVPRRRAEAGVMDARGELVGAMSSTVEASYRDHSRQQLTGAVRTKDRADRATSEQVLDPRTLKALQVMRRAEVFDCMNGVLATGKEANVYHATTAGGDEVAIKIFKTSILVFKDRDRYVTGDFRFRTGYCRSNPRKMVKAWAEKERRNLARIHGCGIRSPQPLHLRMHLLAMQFIGADGVPACRLKDARMSRSRTHKAYFEMVQIIRKLYQQAHLVHADLSEWNVLFHEDELYVIDVGQAVDLDHPHCLEFLREDALHVNSFFQKQGVPTLTIREVFDFAVDPSIPSEEQDAVLQQLLEAAASRPAAPDDDLTSTEEEVFRQAFIPRRLGEVADHEGDHVRLTGGGSTEGIYYQSIAGMKADMSGARDRPPPAEPTSEATSEESGASLAAAGADTLPIQLRPATAQDPPGEGPAPNPQVTAGPAQAPTQAAPPASAAVPQAEPSLQGLHSLGPVAGKLPGSQRQAGGIDSSSRPHPGDSSGPRSGAGQLHEHQSPPCACPQDRIIEGGSSDSESAASTSSEADSQGDGHLDGNSQLHTPDRDALREARKAHKQAVKADKRERRKTKTPKHVKKRAEKAHKRR